MIEGSKAQNAAREAEKEAQEVKLPTLEWFAQMRVLGDALSWDAETMQKLIDMRQQLVQYQQQLSQLVISLNDAIFQLENLAAAPEELQNIYSMQVEVERDKWER